VFADDHPREKGTDGQRDSGRQRDQVAAHARTEHVPDDHDWASFHSSYQAIWIASSFGSLDDFGSSLNPSRARTRSRKSVKRTVSGSRSGNFSANAIPMSSESVHFMSLPALF